MYVEKPRPVLAQGTIRMKTTNSRVLAWGLIGALSMMASAGGDAAEAAGDENVATMSHASRAVVVRVREGTLREPSQIRVFKEILAKAEADGAAAVIFDINVSDGDIQQARRWADEVAGLKVPTVAYVNRSALAEAAALACASDRIIMAPGGRIGLAPAIAEIDSDLAEVAQEQVLAKNRAEAVSLIESLCGRKGHNAVVARAFVDPGREVKVGDVVVSVEGEILSLSAELATREVEGKPLFAEKVVGDVDELVASLEGSPEKLEVTVLEFDRARTFSGSRVTEDAVELETSEVDGEGKLAGSGAAKGTFALRASEESYAGKIVVIEIDEDDLVNRARFAFMNRTLTRANEEGATAVIFDINTPGGLAWDTSQIIIGELQRMKCPTYAFVNPAAISAGSLIACACDEIYMSPGGTIGASAVVMSNYAEMGEVERAKMNSAFSAFARSSAEAKKGRYRLQVVECFVILEKELVIEGEVIDGPGTLLTLTGKEAVREYGGEPLLAKGIVRNLEELIAAEGLEGEMVVANPLGMERFAELVAAFAGILIMLGVAGAYMEFKTPGFGIAGLISVLAFATFFFGHYVAGSLVGYEAVVIVALGAILLAVEFFLFPGTMVFGATGLLLMVGGLVYTMAGLDWGIMEGDSVPTDFSAYGRPIMNVAIGFGGGVIIIFFLMRYLPETSMFRWLVLESSVGGNPTVVLEHGGVGGGPTSMLVGHTGVSKTALKPSGRAMFGDELLDVVSDGEYVASGEPIRIIKQEGPRIVVEKIG